MEMTQLPLAEARAKLSELVGRAEDHHERIVITVHGKPVAMLMGIYDYESMKETLEILGDPVTMAEIRQGERELHNGEGIRVEAGTTLAEFLKTSDEATAA